MMRTYKKNENLLMRTVSDPYRCNSRSKQRKHCTSPTPDVSVILMVSKTAYLAEAVYECVRTADDITKIENTPV